ncbi:hypothetical protein Kpho01_54800 [Kitasatospora phosalacinea]|uniref:Uncharacterized protein n=1 Tax=Kitasatospora phosalacinea TaxID=2065 RepID=A0A9W6PMA0_9ACTN|nr:hypothetical protein Kpho01_54800 [Kitasatospora phosalacinea]
MRGRDQGAVGARAHLAAGRPAEAARIAAAEAARAHASGERLAETEALIAHATAATRLGDDATARTARTRADHLTRTLPYPPGTPGSSPCTRSWRTDSEHVWWLLRRV